MMVYIVEGLRYDEKCHAVIVARRFARRYGRDIRVVGLNGKCLFTVTQAGDCY